MERRRQEEQNTLKDEELICCTLWAFDNEHTYASQLPTEDTKREEPPTLHCRSVHLQAVDNVVVVWHSTLSQSEHAVKDSCISVEIGMVILTLVLMGRLNNQSM